MKMGNRDKNVGNMDCKDYPDIAFYALKVGISPSDKMCLIFRIADHSEIWLKVLTSTSGHHLAVNHLPQVRKDFLEM